MRPTRVLAYVRVSSEQQERGGTSLQGQREEIAAYCAAVRWPPPRFFVEAESAGGEKLESRAEMRALLGEARAGDVVVVAKQDRWSRDTLFFLQSIADLQKRSVRFLSLAERFDPDTPEGRFAATVMAAVAEQERERIKARTAGRRAQLRDQGCWTEGVSPFGYRRDPATRRLVVQPVEAERVREAYARCIAGQALPTIAAAFRDAAVGRHGGPPIKWDRKAVHKLLRARWYLGEICRVDGTWSPAHEAIVSRDIYEQAQASLARRRLGGRNASSESRTSSWLLRGGATCGSCGARMGAAYSRMEGHLGYYACAGRLRGGDCDQPYARVDAMDAEAGALALRRLEELSELLSRAELPGGPSSPDADRAASLRAALDGARNRRARAVSLAVDGLMDREELRRRAAKLDVEIGRIEAQLAEEGRRTRIAEPSLRAEALASVERIRIQWGRLNVDGRRAILARLVERVDIADSALRMTWRGVEAMLDPANQATVGRSLFLPTAAKPRRVPRK